ncbi:MAG: DUF1232 domain-containing protein [Planctomycetota bacterium]
MNLLRLFFSERTPTWAKVVFGLLALAYLASPLDFIPDVLLGPGFIDDLIVVPLLLWIGTWFSGQAKEHDAPQDGPRRRKKVDNEAPRRKRDDGSVGERSDGMSREI